MGLRVDGMTMEVSLRCKTASVMVVDADGYEVAYFDNIKVKGNTGMCNNSSGGYDEDSAFLPAPGKGDGAY